MNTTLELGVDELTAQGAELLPERAAMSFFSLANVRQFNFSNSLSLGGFLPFNSSTALSNITIF
jgi:hypothetical protein